jgi:predicted DNA-binding antitoxin AbrB/MazE fold protein
MKQIVEAIYENGVFKPMKPLNFFEGQQVQLEIENIPEANPDDLLELAGMVYDGLTGQEIDEIEKIATDRRDFFGENLK